MSETVLVPDGITAIVGWRAWRVTAKALGSINNDAEWPRRQAMRAGCEHGPQRTMYMGGSPGTYIPVSEEQVAIQQAAIDFMHYGFSKPVYDRKAKEWGIPVKETGELLVVPRSIRTVKRVPAEKCSCGIYAAAGLEEAQRYVPTKDSNSLGYLMRMGGPCDGVLGRVALWGTVIEHEGGWRGEYAYPQAFYTDDAKIRDALRDYGVPILSIGDLPTKKEETPTTATPTSSTMATGGWLSAVRRMTVA